MVVNFSTMVYYHCYEFFARPITVTPVASQPGQPAYSNRGIYRTRELAVPAEDGSIISDQETLIYVRDSEYGAVPQQFDRIVVPAVEDIPGEGEFVVIDASRNGGGETKLTVRKYEAPKPA